MSKYRPIYLLSTVGKVKEICIHKNICLPFQRSRSSNSFTIGILPGDATANQLVDIFIAFCKALDDGKEVKAVSCDISKDFDPVWHKGLLFKFEQTGIESIFLGQLPSK